jgi:hypothetical protein
MANAETTPGKQNKGTLPGYLPHLTAKELSDLPIGTEGLISVFEEADILALGGDRAALANMTPEDLKELADMEVDQSNNFLGV